MQLRTKLLLAFVFMISLAGTIAYNGYHALQEVETSRAIIVSCEEAKTELLEGNNEGSRFLLYKKKQLLETCSKHFKKTVNGLKKVSTLTSFQAIRDAITSQVKHIQQVGKNYQELGKKYEALTVSFQKFAEHGKKTVASVKTLAKALRALDMDDTVMAMMSEFYEIRILVYRFINDPTVELQEQIGSQVASFIADGKKYEKTIMDMTANKQLKLLIANMSEYQKLASEYTSATLSFHEQIPLVSKMVRKARQEIDTLAEKILQNQRKSLQRSQTILMLVTLAILCLGLGIAYLLTRNVLSQLGRDPGVLVKATQKVMAGDFRINDNGPKIGVYGAFVDMVKNLEDNIAEANRQTELAKEESDKAQEATARAEEAQKRAEQAKRDGMLHAAEQLEGIVSVVSSASEQLSAQIEQSSRGAEEQATRVSETATAMEEMNGAVLEVARNAGQASELSGQAREKAQTGEKIVKEAGDSMTALQQQSEALKTDMNELDEHASSISQIMSVISDIADQTNLLALNAAIEAARAGEAGRGFAVVADEVRKLAEKTMDSTADVSKAITEIQESATKNIRQVERTGTVIEQVTEKSRQASSALAEIVALVDESADQIRAIATASEQQSATSEEINRSVTEINTISGETSQAMREASQAVVELSRQSQELGGLIQDMKNS